MILQDKIQLFLNKAQSKICELALDSAKDLSEAYLNSNAIALSIELMDVVEALQDEVLDWTDKEIESIIDYYTWKARLNDIALLVFEDKQQTIIVVDSSTVDNSWVPSFNSLSAEVDANHQYTVNEVTRLDTRIDNLDFSNLVPQELIDEVDANTAARHSHNNKGVLDGITQGKVDDIGLNTTHRNTPQIHITNTERNLWNAKVDTATLNAGLATKANTVHQHEIQDVNGLTQALEDRNPIPGPAGQDGMQPVLIAGTITDGAYSINIDSTNPQSPVLNLVVPAGKDGTDFHIDEYLLSAQRLDSVKYDNVEEGYSILGTDNGVMYYRNPTDDLGNFISASTSTGWYAVQYAGANGWSPVFAIENVSVSRSVYKLVSWVGGTGTPPAFTNVYVTPYGYSPNEYEAANIQGIPGPTGAAGKVMFPDVAGDTATKANYDSYPKDFIYLDTTLGLIYIKRSDTSGDWAEGYQWKGDTGNQGPTGDTGPAGADSTVPGPQGPIGETGQGYTWKGQWSSITPYVEYDTVFDLGSSYVCVTPVTGGNNPATNTSFEVMVDGAEVDLSNYVKRTTEDLPIVKVPPVYYNWYAATDVRGIAPIGFHVPTRAEAETLIAFIGGSSSGGKLKSTAVEDWDAPNTGATNEYGFNARGNGWKNGDMFNGNRTLYNTFLSTLGNTSYNACSMMLYNDSAQVYTVDYHTKKGAESLRCIKDNNAPSVGDIVDASGNKYTEVVIGTQIWLAEDLRTTKYANGDIIPNITNGTTWSTLTTGAMCYYQYQSLTKYKQVVQTESGDIMLVDSSNASSGSGEITVDNAAIYDDTTIYNTLGTVVTFSNPASLDPQFQTPQLYQLAAVLTIAGTDPEESPYDSALLTGNWQFIGQKLEVTNDNTSKIYISGSGVSAQTRSITGYKHGDNLVFNDHNSVMEFDQYAELGAVHDPANHIYLYIVKPNDWVDPLKGGWVEKSATDRQRKFYTDAADIRSQARNYPVDGDVIDLSTNNILRMTTTGAPFTDNGTTVIIPEYPLFGLPCAFVKVGEMGSGGGGHIIADSDEQFTQQPVLKFIGAVNVTNGVGETIVEVTAQPITVDAVPTDGSNNPVASNGVFDALALKVDTLNQTAANVIVDATGFNGNLAPTDTNAQLCFQKLDDLVLNSVTSSLITPFTSALNFNKFNQHFATYTQTGILNFTLVGANFGNGASIFVTIVTNGNAINFSSDFIKPNPNDYKNLVASSYDFLFVLRPDGKVRVSIVNISADIVSPQFLSYNDDLLNDYIDISFTEGAYGANDGSTPLSLTSFIISNFVAGGCTALSINSITNTSGGALVGGETAVRLGLTRTGTPDSTETFRIKPASGSSVFDKSGNSMLSTDSIGNISLYTETFPTSISGRIGHYDFSTTPASLNGSKIITIADISGSGNDLTQATDASRPTWTASGGSNNKGYGTFSAAKVLTKTPYTLAQPCTIIFVSTQKSYTSATSSQVLDLGGSTLGITQQSFTANSLEYKNLSSVAGLGWSNYGLNNFILNETVVYGWALSGGGGRYIWGKGSGALQNGPGTTSFNKLQIGSNLGPTFDMYECLFYNRQLTISECLTITRFFQFKYKTTNRQYLAVFGDSIANGSNATSNVGFTSMVARARNWSLINHAASGSTINDVYNKIVSEISNIPTNAYVIIEEGSNDGPSAAWEQKYVDTIVLLNSYGIHFNKIVCVTPPYRSNRVTQNTFILEAFARIKATYGVVTVDVVNPMLAAGGDALIADGIHPTTAGHIVMCDTTLLQV